MSVAPVPIDIGVTLPTILRSIILGQRGFSAGHSHLTVSEAAITLGIGRPALAKVLNGHADLSLELAVKIEDVFRYSALALLQHQAARKLAEYRRTIGSTILPIRAPTAPPWRL